VLREFPHVRKGIYGKHAPLSTTFLIIFYQKSFFPLATELKEPYLRGARKFISIYLPEDIVINPNGG